MPPVDQVGLLVEEFLDLAAQSEIGIVARKRGKVLRHVVHVRSPW